MKLSTGDPAIVEAQIGQGRSIVVAAGECLVDDAHLAELRAGRARAAVAGGSRAGRRSQSHGRPAAGRGLRTLATDTLVSVEPPGGESHTVRLEAGVITAAGPAPTPDEVGFTRSRRGRARIRQQSNARSAASMPRKGT